ncbi:glycosyltransferase family 4 protein [Patescibacteria group bacterium]|nr:glycosyltransferase family 4 protein [Patescibacteria group bacterium]MBU0963857.1 glycosyltransferase family 4 protein [Patescibacteria group bacterium]
MKNVLILKFPHSSLFGGGEQHTILLVEELQKKGFNFFLASSCRVLLDEFRKRKWPAQRAWAGPEPVSKISILSWPFVAPFAFVSVCLLLMHYRWWKKTTLLYCLSLTEKILATIPARLLGMKVVWVEHVTFERWLIKNPLKVYYKLFSRQATIVAISQVIKQQLIEKISIKNEKILVIYNGVDLGKFTMKQYRWEKAARFNIGCVARLEKEKGIEFLIQAIKMVREYIPFIRLIIVGEGSEKRRLMWLAERLGLKEIIQWVGYQHEIEKWYGFFDAYALPSVKRESFGITIVEAMASGVPVVASRLGGIPEIVEHKKTGLLAEPGSSQSLADQLLYLFNNRAETREIVMQAREIVEQKFSLDRMIRDYYLLFRK